MRKPVSLLLMALLLLVVVAPVMAFEPIDNLIASGKMSNNDVYMIWVDLLSSSNGTVTSTVYKTVNEDATFQIHNVTPQPYGGANGAKDKLSRFFLYLGNNNRHDTVMGLKGGTPDETVAGYVYGERKNEIINTYVGGIVECLGNPALWTSDSGDSSPTNATTAKEDKKTDAWAEKYLATTFEIGTATYSVLSAGDTTAINNKPEVKTMDVAPYIKGARTYVPVRYLAYSLGVAEDAVTWDGNSRKVGISKNNTNIALVIGSPVMQVNKKPITMDASPEITGDRTFLPARWVAEALGAKVEWDDATRTITINM
jgi:hypothetical protein